MNSLFSKIINLLFFIIIFNTFKLEAESVPVENITSQNSEFLIESNLQRSDLKNSIFYHLKNN